MCDSSCSSCAQLIHVVLLLAVSSSAVSEVPHSWFQPDPTAGVPADVSCLIQIFSAITVLIVTSRGED